MDMSVCVCETCVAEMNISRGTPVAFLKKIKIPPPPSPQMGKEKAEAPGLPEEVFVYWGKCYSLWGRFVAEIMTAWEAQEDWKAWLCRLSYI